MLKNVLHERVTAWGDLLRTLLAGLKKELSNFNKIRVNESKIKTKKEEEEKKGQCNRNLVWLQRLKRWKAKGTSCIFYLLVFGLRCAGASLQMSASQKANQKKELWSGERAFEKEYIYRRCNVAHQATWIMRDSRWEGGWIRSAPKWEGWWKRWVCFAGAFVRDHSCSSISGLSFVSLCCTEQVLLHMGFQGANLWLGATMTKLSPQIISRKLAKHQAKVCLCLYFPRASESIEKLKDIAQVSWLVNCI